MFGIILELALSKKNTYFLVVNICSFLEIYCPALDIPANGKIFPLSCNASRTTFGDQCRYRCQEGYRLTGPSSRECIYPGVWTDHQLVTRCVGTCYVAYELLNLILLFNDIKITGPIIILPTYYLIVLVM